MINKICSHELDNIYNKWIEYYNKGGKSEIYGTGCYIVSRKGINKLKEYVSYEDDNTFNFNTEKYNKFHVADIYLYRILKTYVYKYNFINLLDHESTIQIKDELKFHRKCSKKQHEIILNDFVYSKTPLI